MPDAPEASHPSAGECDESSAEPTAPRAPVVEATLPSFAGDPQQPLGACIDRAAAVDATSLFVRGWIFDAGGIVDDIRLSTAEGERTGLFDSLVRNHRPDVDDLYRPAFGEQVGARHGFVGLIDVGSRGIDQRLIRLELRAAGETRLQVEASITISNPFSFRADVLQLFPEEQLLEPALLEGHLHPTLRKLQARCRTKAAVRGTFECGGKTTSPRASLVIPLWRRIDLVEHQLAQFADDDSLRDCEILYVLDSPDLELAFRELLPHLADLYRISIRGVVCEVNAGYAAAVNLGAMHARGELLVLLHSDVFPAAPGWLDTMAATYGADDSIGALGAKLLYEDQSVQHAGISFRRDLNAGRLWSPIDLCRGLPRRSPGPADSRRVPAVSGACLMIRRDLFARLEGLRSCYIAGDHEDVDLCLRCAEDGLTTWYEAAAELHHLGGQSQEKGPGWRRNPISRRYNRWLLNRRWGGAIADVMTELDAEGR